VSDAITWLIIAIIIGLVTFFAIAILRELILKKKASTVAAPQPVPQPSPQPNLQPTSISYYTDDEDEVRQFQQGPRPTPESFHEMISSISIPDPYGENHNRGHQTRGQQGQQGQQERQQPSSQLIGINEQSYAPLVQVAPKISLFYINASAVNRVSNEATSLKDLVPLDSTGRIARDLFCKACRVHFLIRDVKPAAACKCTTCDGSLVELVLPRDLKMHDVVRLDNRRLDCLEIIALFFKQGYFSGTGRVYKATIEKFNTSGHITIANLPEGHDRYQERDAPGCHRGGVEQEGSRTVR
jgi:hypothetical protein